MAHQHNKAIDVKNVLEKNLKNVINVKNVEKNKTV